MTRQVLSAQQYLYTFVAMVTVTREGAETSLWARVSAALQDELGAGSLAVGERLPSEAALTRRFGVSRVTLRQALSNLEQRGFVHPQAGRGWFVGAARAEQPVSEDPGMLQSFTEMATGRGLRAGAVVLHCTRRPADWDEAHDLGIAPGAALLSLRRLRQLDGIAVAVDHSLVPAALLPDVDAPDFRDASLYAALTRHGVRPFRADYEVQAIAADAEHAELLDVPVGAPLLAARQICVDDGGRRIERGHITYRGDRYRFRAVLHA
ncbi:MAG: GntR family transcriptional regulator [Actinomycetota bacterium]